jgi:SAM-dependent methyltransferase
MLDLIKRFLPAPLFHHVKRWRNRQIRRQFAARSLKETFTLVYTENYWGGSAGEFKSGSGSGQKYAADYSQHINAFVDTHAVRAIVDLGCGDFQIGRLLARPGLQYIGIDIVEPLIEENQRRYAGPNVQFACLDITREQLPTGDLCLIRQVLQHLSNAEIQAVLENCRHYKYVIVTDHVPTGEVVTPNVDKPHGPDIRLYDNSGVFLDKPPFNRKVELLFALPEHDERGGGLLQTVLLVNDYLGS